MTNESKQSQRSGSSVLASKTPPKNAPEIVVSGVVRLRSLLDGGGDHAGSGLSIPAKGVIFEADQRGHELVAAGLAEVVAPEGAKGE